MRSIAALLVVLAVAAPAAAKHKKKRPAPPPPPTEETAPPVEAPPPPPPPVATPEPEPEPEPPPPPRRRRPEPPPEPTIETDWFDTSRPDAKQYFLGVRYRATVVPAFMMHLFVDEGATVVSNSVGIELDVRRVGGASIIPNLTFTEYGMGDTLFLQKGANASDPANWSMINSSMKAIFAGVDMAWSTNIAHGFDFEYGFGVGVGVVFGDLVDNWVYSNPNGALVSSSGARFSRCQTQSDGRGCSVFDHSNATTAKVGGYVEPNWFNGGPVPSLYLRIAAPTLALRIHPVRDFEARLSAGFSITEGFFFGLSGNYRLPID